MTISVKNKNMSTLFLKKLATALKRSCKIFSDLFKEKTPIRFEECNINDVIKGALDVMALKS